MFGGTSSLTQPNTATVDADVVFLLLTFLMCVTLKELESSSAVQLQHCRTQLHQYEQKYAELQVSAPTDLHIYNLDAAPPIHVISNHVDTDKLTTANGETLTSSSASRSTQSR